MNVKDWLIDWFVKNTDIQRDKLLENLHENYLEIGWIDSFKFISLITEMEDKFKIHFSNDSFQDRDFSTVLGLTRILEGMTNGKV